jgi:hypothetical protein
MTQPCSGKLPHPAVLALQLEIPSAGRLRRRGGLELVELLAQLLQVMG